MPAPSTATIGWADVSWRAATIGRGEQRGVDAAGERLDEHGPLVGHVVADRGGAVTRGRRTSGAQPPPVEQQNPVWMPGSRWSGREVGVVVAVAGSGAVERGSEAAGLVAEDRFEDHPGAVVEFADHLVAGDERERHPVVEVQRRVSFDERQVGAADAGEAGVHPVPARAGQLGFVDARRSRAGRAWWR